MKIRALNYIPVEAVVVLEVEELEVQEGQEAQSYLVMADGSAVALRLIFPEEREAVVMVVAVVQAGLPQVAIGEAAPAPKASSSSAMQDRREKHATRSN